jgi:hypothetical protein
MDRKEKILLLELILCDIRGYWGSGLYERVQCAYKIAKEVELQPQINTIEEFIRICEKGEGVDGRHFRGTNEQGGCEEMWKLHNLPYTISDKSLEFKELAQTILYYPEYRFEDWEHFIELLESKIT